MNIFDFLNKTITDPYCNGWTDSYDGEGAVIEYVGRDYVIIRKENGKPEMLDFHGMDNETVVVYLTNLTS